MYIMEQLVKTFSNVLARFQLQLNLHPIIYLLFFFVAADHFWITVLYANNQMILFLKWLDFSYFHYQFDPKILLYIVIPMVLLPFILIIVQIYNAIKYPKIEISIFQKYCIKFIGSLGLFMASGFMLTSIRTCVNIFWLGQFDIHYYLAWLTLIIYTGIVLPFYGFFIVDLSSNSGIVYSSVAYLNFERWMPFMRVALVYANVLEKLAHASLVYISLPISMFWFYKEPIFHYNHDRYFRLVIFGMCWIMVIRSVANTFGQPIAGGIICTGCPMFIVYLFWSTQIRIKNLMQKQVPTMKQIKILVSFLNDYSNNLNHLTNFLLYHQKKCQDSECLCHSLQIILTDDKQKMINWYQLISSIIRTHFNEKSLSQLPKSKKLSLLTKLSDLVIIQADYLAKVQHKRNNGLYLLNAIQLEIQNQQFYCLNFKAYCKRYKYEMESKMIYDCKQEGTINNYALKYYNYQRKVQNMIISMRQSTIKHQTFWVELLKKQPDIEKIIKYIKKAYQCNLKVQMIIKDLINQKTVEPILYSIYATYYDKVANKQLPKPSIVVDSTQKLSKNMKNFSYQSKTPTCVVNINNSEKFGQLVHSNLYFEELTGHSCQSIINVDSFILTPFIKLHRQKMQKFVNNGLYMAQRKKVIMKDLNQKIFFIDIIIQLYPSLENGLNACVFLIPLPGEPIFITNSKGQIINYSHQFQDEMISKNEVQELDEVFDQKMFEDIKQKKTLIYYLRQIKYKMVLQSQLKIVDQNPMYIFKVSPFIEQQSSDNIQQNAYNENNNSNLDQNGSTQFLTVRTKAHKVSFLANSSSSQFRRKSQLKYNGIFKNKASQNYQKVDQKQLQDLKQKSKKQKQKLQKIFNIVQNNQKCKNINLWIFSTLALFLFIIALIIFNIFLVKNKIVALEHDKIVRQEYQQLRITIHQMLYSMRMANLQANIGKNQTTFNLYLKYMNQNKLNAVELNKNLYFRPNYIIQQFQIKQSDQMQISTEQFFVVLQFYILTSLSHVADARINDLSFSFSRLSINNPLNHFQANFLKANLHGLYLIIPNYKQVWQIKKQQLNCDLGQCLQKQSTIIANPIGIIIVILILIETVFMSLKIKNLKETSYILFQTLTRQYIQSRKQSVEIYRKSNFADILVTKINEQEKVFKADGPSTKSCQLYKNSAQLRFKNCRQNIDKIQQTFKTLKPSRTIFLNEKVSFGEKQQGKGKQTTTQRQLMVNDLQQVVEEEQQTNQQTNNVKNETKNNQNQKPIQFTRQSSKSLILSYICLFLPLVIYFISAIIMLVVGVSFIIQHFDNKDLIYDQIIQGKTLKLYTYQLGLDNGQIEGYLGPSIPSILNQSMSNLYQIQRQIISKIVNGKPSSQTARFMNLFNQNDVCANLEKLTNIKPNHEVNFTQQQCKQLQGTFYLTKGRRAAIIAYLQAARLLFERNQNSVNYTLSERQQYLQGKPLKIISSLQNYLSMIQRESLRIYSNEFNQLKDNLQITTYSITGLCLIFIIVAMLVLFKFIRQRLFYDTLQIKAIFHIVSQDTIKQNNQLRILVTEKVNYNFIK